MLTKNTVSQKQIDYLFDNASIEESVVFENCLLVTCQLQNGFIIVESSSCVDKENFDKTIGREICYGRIKDKLWELEGYKLQCELADN